METDAPAPPTPPEPQNVTDLLEQRIIEVAQRNQRQVPALDWGWCLVLARLEVRNNGGTGRTMMAQAAEELRQERRYSHGGGWRVVVDREAR